MKKTLTILATLLCFLNIQAQEYTNSTSNNSSILSFLPQDGRFYLTYKDNEENLKEILHVVNQHRKEILDGNLQIQIAAYSTTDKNEGANRKRSKERANQVRDLLLYMTELTKKNVSISTLSGSSSGYSDIVIVSLPTFEATSASAITNKENNTSVTPIVQFTLESNPYIKRKYPKLDGFRTSDSQESLYNIRTNLLLWALLVPNIGAEWKIKDNVGILLNVGMSNWSKNNAPRQHRSWFVIPEYRHYLGVDKKWFVGGEVHVGMFDLKMMKKKIGRQANCYGAGIVGGYQITLNNKLSMDFHLGLGYTHLSQYKKYAYSKSLKKNIRISDRYKTTKDLFGPSQAGVTLIWNL